jgi:hypothetical protein
LEKVGHQDQFSVLRCQFSVSSCADTTTYIVAEFVHYFGLLALKRALRRANVP